MDKVELRIRETDNENEYEIENRGCSLYEIIILCYLCHWCSAIAPGIAELTNKCIEETSLYLLTHRVPATDIQVLVSSHQPCLSEV